MADLLVRHHSDYGLPMYTTENGGASRLRFARRVYLDPYLRATDEAIARGAEIRA
jgi:beta-glucosidase/6-phospho-beta-glucosidase/beta-galactosidase